MNDDRELLRSDVVNRSESAFTALVQRYLKEVYSTAPPFRRPRGLQEFSTDLIPLNFETPRAAAVVGCRFQRGSVGVCAEDGRE